MKNMNNKESDTVIPKLFRVDDVGIIRSLTWYSSLHIGVWLTERKKTKVRANNHQTSLEITSQSKK